MTDGSFGSYLIGLLYQTDNQSFPAESRTVEAFDGRLIPIGLILRVSTATYTGGWLELAAGAPHVVNLRINVQTPLVHVVTGPITRMIFMCDRNRTECYVGITKYIRVTSSRQIRISWSFAPDREMPDDR